VATETGAGAVNGPVRRVILIGFMGAGKSTIAPVLARSLGWRVLDVDKEIVAQTGRPIAALFRERGEQAFRRLEVELTEALSSGGRVVVAPGGGWITNPESSTMRADPGTRLIWLRLGVREALRRAKEQEVERPLLQHAEPLEEAARLLAEREPLYATADLVIDVDGRTVDEVVDDIVTWLKTSIW
jgi:shikimate kinase